jgi:predicted LPLAT superfamily acyltransferase
MAHGEFDRFELCVEGDELVRAAARSGRGCVLLGSHLGSFDLLMLANQALGALPVTVMMHIDPHSRVRRIAGIDDTKLNVIALGQPDSFLRAFEVLKQGGIVAVLADRADGAAVLRSAFLDHAAPFPIGPHLLAARAAAQVLTCFGLLEGGNRYRVEFVELGPAAACDTPRAGLQPVVDRYAQVLEQFARRYPLNWFNFYPFWTRP